MLKGNLIHPDILAELSRCGRGDKILIADGSYPLESRTDGAELIYLGLAPGIPTVTDVLAAFLSAAAVESAEVMDPGDGTVPEIFGQFKAMLGGAPIDALEQDEFYDACCEPEVRLAISTGEKRICASILLTIGVA